MAPPRTDLYESLGVQPDASSEQIRRAYRQRALQTHPDRLPNDASESRVQQAAEEFRKVNNAYEVLSDEANRRLYDQHGVWPPSNNYVQSEDNDDSSWQSRQHSSQGHRRRHRHHHPYADFFNTGPFYGHFSRSRDSYRFTDPMELFNRVFQEMDMAFHRHHAFGPTMDPFSSPFSAVPFPQPFWPFQDTRIAGFTPFGFNHQLQSPVWDQMPSSSSGHRERRFQSTQVFTQSINGIKHSIRREVDQNGDEYVTKVYPDGRTEHFINGVPQITEHRAVEDSKSVVKPQFERVSKRSWFGW